MGTFVRKIVIVLSSLIFTTATYAANEKAIFAGGCFWCMEPPFEGLKGVISVISGYVCGGSPNPTYKEVSAGGTGHAEAVEILFSRKKLSGSRYLGGNRFLEVCAFFQRCFRNPSMLRLHRRKIKYAASVLVAAVAELPLDSYRIDVVPEPVK